MVLKRLLVTALGALGLGALAAGPAYAQDQIPAPRLYGDISSCGGGMLSMASTGRGSMSLLGMGGLVDQAFDSDATTDGIQMDYTQDAARIVTATGATNESAGLVELLSLANCDNAVANNVSTARGIYNSYVSAKRTFEALEEPNADDTAAYNTARMNKDNYAGDVYNDAYDQAARLTAANKAIMDYNALVGSTGTLAQLKDNVDATSGNAATGGFDDIVINTVADPGGTNRVAGATYRVADFTPSPTGPDPDDPGSTIILTGAALRSNINAQAAPVYGSGNTAGYRAIAGHNSADDTADITTSLLRATDDPAGTRAAFNAAGALQFQVANGTGADTTSVYDRASKTIVTLGQISHELDRWETAVSSLATVLQDAKDAGNVDTRTEEENLRRATLGRDHVKSELNRLTRVVRSQNLGILEANRVTILGPNDNSTDDDVTYANERDLVDAYLGSRNNIMAAANNVRSAISNLDTANRAVQARLKDPGNYLNQLVTLRQYQEMAAKNAQAEAGGEGALQSFKDAVTDAGKALAAARAQRTAHQNLTSEPGSTTSQLLNALLASEDPTTDAFEDDDGQALLNAISDVDGKVSTLQGQLTDAEGNPIDLSNLGNTDAVTENTDAIAALTAMDDPETMEDEAGPITMNTEDIGELDGRVAENERDIGQIQTDLYGTTSGQHADACPPGDGLIGKADCALSRSAHNEEAIGDVNDKLMQKKEYIDNLAAEIGVDPVTGEGTGEGGMSRIDMNAAAIDAEEKARMAADTELGGRIDAEAMARADADEALGGRIDAEATARADADMALGGRIDAEEMARMEADTMLGGRIDAEEMARADADMALGMRIDGEAMARADADLMLGGMIMDEETARMAADGMLATAIEEAVAAGAASDMALGGRISSNADAIAANMNSIGQNASAISDNRNMIGELSDDLDVVRAGVAASMALAGMPAINGRGISIGVGSYDGESAFAVGFQIQGEQASFKVGVTSSGGETGASAGVGFNF